MKKKLVITCVLISLLAGALGWAAAPPSIEVRRVLDEKGTLEDEALLTTDDFATARLVPQQNAVDIGLTRCGARLLREATTNSVGKRLALLLDGKVIAAPVLRAPLTSGHVQISLDHPGDADELARELNARLSQRR